MSTNMIHDGATADLLDAATAVAQAHVARFGPAGPGETGEQYVPLATTDMLIAAPAPPCWAITIYQRTPAMPIIAIVTNHDGGKLLPSGPHVAYQNLALARHQATAEGELWALVEASESEAAA